MTAVAVYRLTTVTFRDMRGDVDRVGVGAIETLRPGVDRVMVLRVGVGVNGGSQF